MVVQIAQWEQAILRGRACHDISDDSAVSCAKVAEPIEMPFGLWTRTSPRKHVLDGLDLHAKGKFLGERTCPGIPNDSRELFKNG